MSKSASLHDRNLNEFLDDVEGLLDSYNQARKRIEKLEARVSSLEAELDSLKNEKDGLEKEFYSQRQATVELTGELERKFKKIKELAGSLE